MIFRSLFPKQIDRVVYLWYNSHMIGNIESESYGTMTNNMICMFGISLFEHTGYCDVMEDGIQYKVAEWNLCDEL